MHYRLQCHNNVVYTDGGVYHKFTLKNLVVSTSSGTCLSKKTPFQHPVEGFESWVTCSQYHVDLDAGQNDYDSRRLPRASAHHEVQWCSCEDHAARHQCPSTPVSCWIYRGREDYCCFVNCGPPSCPAQSASSIAVPTGNVVCNVGGTNSEVTVRVLLSPPQVELAYRERR